MAIQRKPSRVCWMPVMMFCGRPASAVHDSNPYLGPSRRGLAQDRQERERHQAHGRYPGLSMHRWGLPGAGDSTARGRPMHARPRTESIPRRFLGLCSGLRGERNARVRRMSMQSRRVRRGLAASVVVLLMTGLRLPMLAQRAPEPGPQGKARWPDGQLRHPELGRAAHPAAPATRPFAAGRRRDEAATGQRRPGDAAGRPATGDRHDLAVHGRRRAGAQPARRPDAAGAGRGERRHRQRVSRDARRALRVGGRGPRDDPLPG